MTERECLLKRLHKHGYDYIARDKDGTLCAYTDEPIIKHLNMWQTVEDSDCQFLDIFSDIFPDIHWNDKVAFDIGKELEE